MIQCRHVIFQIKCWGGWCFPSFTPHHFSPESPSESRYPPEWGDTPPRRRPDTRITLLKQSLQLFCTYEGTGEFWPSWFGWVCDLWTRWAACAAWCHCSPGKTRDSAGRNPGKTILNKRQNNHVLTFRSLIINALSGSDDVLPLYAGLSLFSSWNSASNLKIPLQITWTQQTLYKHFIIQSKITIGFHM